MKKLRLLIVMLMFTGSAAFAQNDTLLFEDFTVDPTANYIPVYNGNDTVWVNYDADGLADYNGRPQEWYWSPGAFADVDSNDACLFSSSWLANFAPGNRNWLMTPPLTIVDANAVLSWASTPRQTPSFLDGYSILISTTDNIETSFTTTLVQAGQFLSVSATGDPNDFASYTFSTGFIHGEDYTYIQYDGDSSNWIGVMRPFSENLAAFSGQTIYIAFVHDSDDDNLMALDDILVTGTEPTGLAEIENGLQIGISPNPATEKIELSYALKNTSPVSARIYDVQGKLVKAQGPVTQLAGNQRLAVDVRALATGTYSIVLDIKGSTLSGTFVKQ